MSVSVNTKRLMRSRAEAVWSNNDRSFIVGLFDGKCMLMFLHCWSSMAAKWLFQHRLRYMNTKHRNTRRDLVACTADLQDWSYDRTKSKGTKIYFKKTSHWSAEVIIHQQPSEYSTMKMHESFTHLHVVPNSFDFILLTFPCNYNEQRLQWDYTDYKNGPCNYITSLLKLYNRETVRNWLKFKS